MCKIMPVILYGSLFQVHQCLMLQNGRTQGLLDQAKWTIEYTISDGVVWL